MAAHLVGGMAPPPEYVILFLCRNVYHCTPSQLRKENPVEILAHLTCIEWESKANNSDGDGEQIEQIGTVY